MGDTSEQRQKTVIGNPEFSFWLFDSETGFDLTHPSTPTSEPVQNAVRIETRSWPISIDPSKTALVIIDMQNFFLSPSLGRSPESKGLKAQTQLLQHAIPAARKAGIRIVWLNWGLTEEDLKQVPSAVIRAFGFWSDDTQSKRRIDLKGKQQSSDISQTNRNIGSIGPLRQRLGSEMGPITLPDRTVIEAGRMLMRDQWNTQLTPELSASFRHSFDTNLPDVWLHKNRMSGLWDRSTGVSRYLEERGIKTLFFAGVNTDQCVGGTMTDAFSQGFDCIMLSDGAATTSPDSCQEAYEFNATATYGFCTSCEDLWNGINAQQE